MSRHCAIVCFTGNSGLTDYSVSLARAMAPHTSVELLTATSLLPRFSDMGFGTRLLFRRSRHYAVDLPRLALHLLRTRPDMILLQGPLKVPLLEALLWRLLQAAGLRVAMTVHDVLPHYPRPWSRLEYRLFYRAFERLIVHSRAAREGVAALGVTAPLLVVPHGTYDLFCLTGIGRAAGRLRVGGIAPTDFVVLFFGTLDSRKGLLEFLSVARQCREQTGLKFLIAGSSQHAGQEVAPALASARCLPNVILHDQRIAFEDVELYFAASNAVALPYREGSTSGVLKLAVAFGVPVIASRIGDLAEQTPAAGGVLIDAGSGMAEALHAAIGRVQADEVRLAEGMRRAASQSDWQQIGQAYADFLFD